MTERTSETNLLALKTTASAGRRTMARKTTRLDEQQRRTRYASSQLGSRAARLTCIRTQRAARLVRASTAALVRPLASEILPLLEARLPLLELVTRQYITHADALALDDLTDKIVSITTFLNDEQPLTAAGYAALPPPAIDPIQLNQIRICVHLCLDRTVRSTNRNDLKWTRGLRAVVTAWKDHFDGEAPVFSSAAPVRARQATSARPKKRKRGAETDSSEEEDEQAAADWSGGADEQSSDEEHEISDGESSECAPGPLTPPPSGPRVTRRRSRR